jgi:hypothetical protein
MAEFQNRYSQEQIRKFKEAWGKIQAKAWTDAKFKERLKKNPEAVLKEQGAELPAGIRFKVYENTENEHYLVLGEKPLGELTERELQKVVGGIALSRRG